MRRYVINTEDRGLSCTEDEEEQTFLVVMDVDEFQNQTAEQSVKHILCQTQKFEQKVFWDTKET